MIFHTCFQICRFFSYLTLETEQSKLIFMLKFYLGSYLMSKLFKRVYIYTYIYMHIYTYTL